MCISSYSIDLHLGYVAPKKARVFCDLQPDSGELGRDPRDPRDPRERPGMIDGFWQNPIVRLRLWRFNGDLMGFHGDLMMI